MTPKHFDSAGFPALTSLHTGHSSRGAGFSLLELLVVIAILAVVAATQLPALNQTKLSGQAFTCLNNIKQLQQAWLIYSEDSNGYLVLNPGGSGLDGSFAWAVGNMQVPTHATNELYLKNALLFPYTKNPTLYKCPGNTRSMARGVSMNMHMGKSDFGGQAASYRFFTRASQITKPSRFYVFMDECIDTINDALFRTDGQPTGGSTLTVHDWPAYYHDGGAGISFADGHAEMHQWRELSAGPPPGHSVPGSTVMAPVDKPYLLTITSEPLDGSY